MSGRKVWKPRTRFKETLHKLTGEWGIKKEVAAIAGVAETSLGDWARLSTNTLPNVEQAYFIAKALEQNLLDMIGGEIQPRTDRLGKDESRLLEIFSQLPKDKRNLLMNMAETAAQAAGIGADHDSSKQEKVG